MGFAAVARVTTSRWITCSVRDDIAFGLVPGSELQVETTICHEIRHSHQAVVINHVEESDFRSHHTPLMYGFQSYISYPIFLKTGEFFGTLCAIDPKPADLENPTIRGIFNAFADLISFHLQQLELLDESDKAVRNLSRQLSIAMDENRQYRHISRHSLQEPLRKLRVFSDLVMDAIQKNDLDKARDIAEKIHRNAERFSGMVSDLSNFSSLETQEPLPEITNLEVVIAGVCAQLATQIKEKEAIITIGKLPSIPASSTQMEQLFYHLLSNSIKFSQKDILPVIAISCQEPASLIPLSNLYSDKQYLEISIQDNGIGIDNSQLEHIFDMFSQLPSSETRVGEGFGLTFCRKIIQNHKGHISVQSKVNEGTTFLITLPIN